MKNSITIQIIAFVGKGFSYEAVRGFVFAILSNAILIDVDNKYKLIIIEAKFNVSVSFA
jgi:hypothetical protein